MAGGPRINKAAVKFIFCVLAKFCLLDRGLSREDYPQIDRLGRLTMMKMYPFIDNALSQTLAASEGLCRTPGVRSGLPPENDAVESPIAPNAVLHGPSVSVVIPHYNDVPALCLCYARLLAQTVPRETFEIVVADNNSACGIGAVQAAVPEARVVPARIQGAGPARNAGVAASRGQVLAFLDSDCVPEPDWIAEGIAVLERFDFIGGRVKTFVRDPSAPNGVEAFELVFNFNFRRYIEKVGFTGTGNMFVPRAVFDRVGGFRSGVSEDVDWCFRARALGYRLGYAERAVVSHPARVRWADLERRWARMLAESYNLACERRQGRVWFALKALAMPLSVLPHVVKVVTSPRLPTMRARAAAVAVLTRQRLWRARRMLRLVAGGADHSSAQPVRPATAGVCDAPPGT